VRKDADSFRDAFYSGKTWRQNRGHLETEQRAPGDRTEGSWRQNRGHLETEQRAPGDRTEGTWRQNRGQLETEQRAPVDRTEGSWRQNRGHLETEQRAARSLYEYLLRSIQINHPPRCNNF